MGALWHTFDRAVNEGRSNEVKFKLRQITKDVNMVKAWKGHSLHQDAWNWGPKMASWRNKKEAIMTEAQKTEVEEVKETDVPI